MPERQGVRPLSESTVRKVAWEPPRLEEGAIARIREVWIQLQACMDNAADLFPTRQMGDRYNREEARACFRLQLETRLWRKIKRAACYRVKQRDAGGTGAKQGGRRKNKPKNGPLDKRVLGGGELTGQAEGPRQKGAAPGRGGDSEDGRGKLKDDKGPEKKSTGPDAEICGLLPRVFWADIRRVTQPRDAKNLNALCKSGIEKMVEGIYAVQENAGNKKQTNMRMRDRRKTRSDPIECPNLEDPTELQDELHEESPLLGDMIKHELELVQLILGVCKEHKPYYYGVVVAVRCHLQRWKSKSSDF